MKSLTIALAALALLSLAPRAEATDTTLDCDYIQQPDSTGPMPSFAEACSSLEVNNKAQPTSIVLSRNGTRSNGDQISCHTYTWSVDTDPEPTAQSGPILVIPADVDGPVVTPGECTRSTKANAEAGFVAPAEGPAVPGALATAQGALAFGQDIINPLRSVFACNVARVLIYADAYLDFTDPKPMVVELSRTQGADPQGSYCTTGYESPLSASLFDWVCGMTFASGGNDPHTPPCPLNAKRHANPNGWSAYKIVQGASNDRGRKVKVSYTFDPGDGTQNRTSWRQFCGGNGQYVNAARAHYQNHSNPIDFCTCNNNQSTGKCR